MATQPLTATPSTRDHYLLIVDLLDLDPFSERAAQLRAKIARLEQRDPTLKAQRIDLMAEHSRKIGGEMPAQREGIMMR